jgi:Tfp pilus assembly protein PilO
MTNYANKLRQGAKVRFALTLIVLVLAGIFIVKPNYQQLISSRASILELNEESDKVELELKTKRDEYRVLKNNYALEAIKDKNTIATILPIDAQKTEIVRMLEQKVNDIANQDSSNILESINIGTAKEQKGSDHFSLPIKISLNGTKDKLMTFLRSLEETGSTTKNSESVSRFIDIQDINLKIKDRGIKNSSSSEDVAIEISANTYFLPSSVKTSIN